MHKPHVGFHNEQGVCPGCPHPPTDSEILDWLLTERRTVKSHIGGSGMVYHFKSRGEITAAMQAEKGKR